MNVFLERINNIFARSQVIKSMVAKNLKDKYIGSAIGISWAIINPVLITLAVTFVFTHVIKTGVRYFPLLVLSGLLPWSFFVNSICEATISIKQNLDILNRFVIPREIIPLSVVAANFINFLLGFVIMMPIFIIYNISIIKYLWLLPCIMFLHFIFTLGISMLFSVVNVYFKDLSQLLNVGTMFLFWLTPVFYSMDTVPPAYRWLIFANPAASFIVIYQELLYKGSLPGIVIWLSAGMISLISLIGGYYVFISKEKELLKYI